MPLVQGPEAGGYGEYEPAPGRHVESGQTVPGGVYDTVTPDIPWYGDEAGNREESPSERKESEELDIAVSESSPEVRPNLEELVVQLHNLERQTRETAAMVAEFQQYIKDHPIDGGHFSVPYNLATGVRPLVLQKERGIRLAEGFQAERDEKYDELKTQALDMFNAPQESIADPDSSGES